MLLKWVEKVQNYTKLAEKCCYNEFIKDDEQDLKSMKLAAYKIQGKFVCEYCANNCLLGEKVGAQTQIEDVSGVCKCWEFRNSKFECIRTCIGIQYPKEVLHNCGMRCKNCNMVICKYCSDLCHKGHVLTPVSSGEECQCNDRLSCKVRKV